MLFIAIIVFIILCMLVRTPLLVGDTHAHIRYILLYITVGLITCRKVIFLGDIIDGPKGWPLWKSSMAIKLVRWFPWADTILGNHEAYSVFSSNAEENASYWKEEVDEDGNFRPWTEWCNICRWLTKGDMEWLKSRPLYVRGNDWFACHAKPVLPLPAQYVVGKPTRSQIELFDNTKEWFALGAPYCNSLGTVYVGHTPVQKLNGQEQWGKVIVLDGGSKKGGKPFSAVPTNDNQFFITIILMIAIALVGISTSVQKEEVKEPTIVMEEVTTIRVEVDKKPVVVKKQVKKKQVKKPVARKQVIDVPGSIRAWNEEAWCRQYWDKGQKCWFKDRQKEFPKKAKAIAKAFLAVWGDKPIEVQKLALAICLKETGCGFSEQRNWKKKGSKITQTGQRTYKASKFMSNKQACGITQVDTRKGIGLTTCYSLNKSYKSAFEWQKVWLETKWNDGHKTKPTKVNLYGFEWLKPYKINSNTSYLVWRYNGGGKKAWRYGRTVMKIYHNYIIVKTQ